MKWFKHSSTASHDLPVRRILDAYGYQGYGLLWCIRERVELMDGHISVNELAHYFCANHVSHDKVKSIIEMSGMFYVDADGLVHISERTVRKNSPCVRKSARPNLLNSLEIKEKKEGKKNDSSKDAQIAPAPSSDIEKEFYANMQANYPRICQMKYPLTYAEYLRLKKEFTKDVLLNTLNNMENYPKLTSKYLSANLTLRKWINQDSHRK